MGAYYRIINHRARLRVEPGRMDGGGVKWSVTQPGAAARRILDYLQSTPNGANWKFVCSESQEGDDYYMAKEEYRDDTEMAVKWYNEHKLGPTITLLVGDD